MKYIKYTTYIIVAIISLTLLSCSSEDTADESQLIGLWESTGGTVHVKYNGKSIKEPFNEKARAHFKDNHTWMSYTWINGEYRQDFSGYQPWSLKGNKLTAIGGEVLVYTIKKLTNSQYEIYFEQKEDGVTYETYVTFKRIE